MGHDFFLPDSAGQIAAALKKALDAMVDLHDAEKRRHHVTGPDGRFLEIVPIWWARRARG